MPDEITPEVTQNEDGTLTDNVQSDLPEIPKDKEPASEATLQEKIQAAMKPEPKKDAPTTPGKTADAPAYVPNHKYKVLDQEKEFDEWIRPHINKDNESKVRELYEKAMGLDHVKSKLGEERLTKEAVMKQYSNVTGEVKKILQHRDKGDLDTFFRMTNIPKETVLRWAIQQAQLIEATKDLPEDAKRVYNEYGDLKQRTLLLEEQLENMSSGHVEHAVQARTSELDGLLERPDVSPLASAFDTRLGKAGSFRDLVVRHGKAEWDASQGKRDLSPEQAVNEVINLLGLKSQVADPATTPNEPAAPIAPRVVQSTKPTVLPNPGTGNGSAAVVKPKSLDDLRKMAKAAAG